jgi:hypothetical protein
MARGKMAARNANRRADEVSAQIEQLNSTLAATREAHRVEVAELRAKLGQTQGALSREVKTLADKAVRDARQQAANEVAQARAEYLERVAQGFYAIDQAIRAVGRPVARLELLGHDGFIRIAEAFGVEVGPLLARAQELDGATPGRNLSRTTNRSGRWKLRAQGLDPAAASTRGQSWG